VNQPRLTTEDDQVITIPENDDELLMEETTMEDSEQVNFFYTYNRIHFLYHTFIKKEVTLTTHTHTYFKFNN